MYKTAARKQSGCKKRNTRFAKYGFCKDCGSPMSWGKTNGRFFPMNTDGSKHYCRKPIRKDEINLNFYGA